MSKDKLTSDLQHLDHVESREFTIRFAVTWTRDNKLRIGLEQHLILNLNCAVSLNDAACKHGYAENDAAAPCSKDLGSPWVHCRAREPAPENLRALRIFRLYRGKRGSRDTAQDHSFHFWQLIERVEKIIPMLGQTQLSNYLTLKGSFSAVSEPNFASEYAFESSR